MNKDHQDLDIELEQFMQANGWEYKPNKGGTFYWQQFNGIYKSQMGISEARQLLIHCKSLITLEVEKAVKFTLDNVENISYLPSGKTYQFKFGGSEDLLTSATNRVMEHLSSLNNKKENV